MRPATPLSSRLPTQIKICGLRDPAQAAAVAALGVDAIGVIGVAGSPRYVAPALRPRLFTAVGEAAPACTGVLVVADPDDADLADLEPAHGHRILQLHGRETPERCSTLGQRLGCRIWKAFRIRSRADLALADAYRGHVDALLLDAYVPDQLGGTGHRLPLDWIEGWCAPLPWWLAGGISPERVGAVLQRVAPTGVDVSSGVERSPADKDLARVAALVAAVRSAV
ncbi:phosphoribosylanthranilate isomerase [Cyanobium sp. NIES-981]|uniref:phosphoribosylanthranilate isomerase n=1 Tax=Cyanobium sp. NIES-981 TaxID=1851505 RepID=UPI0007DD0740|nr:phosphoribosylanthranilate isomerase [Cyanobium sp. NIES-981]SBO42565.1 N-(5'-phosphoribosyl)anthranilate isomerase [Cyanobium sp. NIES-981]